MILEQVKVVPKWFVAERNVEDDTKDFTMDGLPYLETQPLVQSNGFDSVKEIPDELLQADDVILFKAYQLELNGKPVVFSNEHKEEEMNYFFTSEEKAKEFVQDIINSIVNDNDTYWDDDSERNALSELDYDLDEDDDISEISINEGRRWNEFLGMWYLREFDGLGYTVWYNDQEHTI